MQFKSVRAGIVLALALAVAPVAAEDARYEAALDQLYQATYGREISQMNIDEVVQGFRDSTTKKADAQNCPALKSAMNTFADNQFRRAVTAYFQSPVLKNQIKDAMRKHYRQADLDAFLAFAASPAGKTFLDHQIAANVEVKSALKDSTDKMLEAPEIKAMMGEMMVELLPVMMKCQKG